MSDFDRAFPIIVGIEAGYTTDPQDPGNWTGGKPNVGELKGTKYGISAAAYPNIDIANLTVDGAKALYKADYWDAVEGDYLPWPLSCLVFDCAVNQGQGTAKQLLQAALSVAVDGSIGPATLKAATASTPWHDAHFMNLRRVKYMQAPNWAHDGDGWMHRLFEVALQAGG